MVDYVCATGTKSFHYIPDVDLEIARPVTSSMHKMHRASTDTYISEGFCKYGIKASIKDGSLFYTVSFTRKGRLHETDKANTLTARTPTASLGNFTPITGVLYQEEKPRIRKLTPLEALRLMGVNEEDAAVIKSANSDTRCYMMAGNSIVVDVLVHIFRQIFEPDLTEITEPHQIDIFEYLRQENIYE